MTMIVHFRLFARMEEIVALLQPARSHNCTKSFSHEYRRTKSGWTWTKRGENLEQTSPPEVNCKRFVVILQLRLVVLLPFIQWPVSVFSVLCVVCARLMNGLRRTSQRRKKTKGEEKSGAPNTFGEWYKNALWAKDTSRLLHIRNARKTLWIVNTEICPTGRTLEMHAGIRQLHTKKHSKCVHEVEIKSERIIPRWAYFRQFIAQQSMFASVARNHL